MSSSRFTPVGPIAVVFTDESRKNRIEVEARPSFITRLQARLWNMVIRHDGRTATHPFWVLDGRRPTPEYLTYLLSRLLLASSEADRTPADCAEEYGYTIEEAEMYMAALMPEAIVINQLGLSSDIAWWLYADIENGKYTLGGSA